jgi:Tol biopolymer transport system component
MGEVYRASDTRLDRVVALKLLPAPFASDRDRIARFEREAKLLASLDQPNIAHVYGFESAPLPGGGEVHLLAMELVPGEDLAERLTRGAIPVEPAVAIARQMADALEAAHDKGIVHRDLKPANVKLAPGSVVKILDFGLAKAYTSEAPEGASDASQSPTRSMPLTRDGAIFGTPAYMSPEQARGLAVDKRADVWSFGCVLFEMLAGQRPFDGHTSTDTLAAVLARDPDWSLLPVTIPPALHRLLRRCLAKDPGSRLRDIGDARIELDDVSRLDHVELARVIHATRTPHRRYLAAVTMAILLALGAAAIGRRLGGPVAGPPPVTRTSIVLPPGQKLHSGDSTYSLALSADGLRLAYVGEQEGRTQLYLRELRGLEPRVLAGTAGATQPFFSPDGEWVGYFASGALQKVAITGGAPLRICAVSSLSRGASWGRDGRIVFALRGSGLHFVDASGGAPTRLGDLEEARWPEILPDGRNVLFTISGAIATVPIGGGRMHVVAKTNDSPLEGTAALGTGAISQARYLPSGHLVYGQSPGIVRAAAFDVGSLRLVGPMASVVESVERARNNGAVYFAVSASGMLVYASTGNRHQLVWVDRSGVATPISDDRQAFRAPRISPDGTKLAVGANDETRRSDVWVYDLRRGTRRRLTTESHNGWPVWTRDGRRIAFSNSGELAEVPADGSGPPAILWSRRDGIPRYPSSWSPDGRELLLEMDGPAGLDVLVLSRGGEARSVLAGSFNEQNAEFSPGGRFVAYVSDESGRMEVYVASYPGFEDRTVISTDGGAHPRWSQDGRELFYRQGDALMAAGVDIRRNFRSERPRKLFAGPYSSEGRGNQFDVAPDGRRFAMVRDDEASALRELTVVQGWFEELSRRVPSSR